ncbi:hypothetical protein D3C75_558480 [compost metagenome]
MSLPQTTQRNLRLQGFTLCLGQFTGHIGIDEPRSHRVYRNRTRTDFARQSTAETFQAGLGGSVVYLACVAHGTHNRANTDNSAPTSFGHAAQNALGQAEQTVQIGIDNVVPLVVFHAHHQVIAGDTGIIDQNRRRTELLLNARQNTCHGLVAGDIEFQASALNTVFLQGRGNALSTRRGGRGTNNDGALTTQFQGDSLADATACTGDQCNFTLQTHASFS